MDAELLRQILAIKVEVAVLALKLRMLSRLNPRMWWQEPESLLDQASYTLEDIAKAIERGPS
jgi:hypothetical protein